MKNLADFLSYGLSDYKKISFICNPEKNDLVAQPVEQLTLNQWVESSSLSQVTKKPSSVAGGLFY